MEEKIIEWLGLDELNDYVKIDSIWSNDIENYHESIYLVTEQYPNKSWVDVYILRLFGFDNNINLSQDYCQTMLSFDELLVKLPKLIKLIINDIGD